MKLFDRAFVTGCDQNTEWMLPWFLRNYWEHNNTPLIFVNFGVSTGVLMWLHQHDAVSHIMSAEKVLYTSWYQKPQALLNAPSKQKFWIDTDCEVLDDISDVFKYIKPEKICLSIDQPWTLRREGTWYNSGVFGVENNPKILKNWATNCRQKYREQHLHGDQDILHDMINTPMDALIYIEELPNEFNVLRLQILDGTVGKKRIMHWTGVKGKDHIRRVMND